MSARCPKCGSANARYIIDRTITAVNCADCDTITVEEDRGYRESCSQDSSRASAEGSERPGADATGTSVAVAGEDAGEDASAGDGTYPGIDRQESDYVTASHRILFKDGIVVTLGRDVIRDMGAPAVKSLWSLAREAATRRYAGADFKGDPLIFTATEMRKLMEDAGMLRPQSWYTPTVGTKTIPVTVGGGGGGGGYSGGFSVNVTGSPGTIVFTYGGAGGGSSDQTSPKPIEDGGIVVGEIVAWRCWRVAAHGVLHSMSAASYAWTPGEPATTEGDASLEAYQHGHGVHAWKKRKDAMAYAAASPTAIVGKILLSGNVIEHERGYRAECGQIESLDWIVSELPANAANDLLTKARTMYGVGGVSSAVKPIAVTQVNGPMAARGLFWFAIAVNLGMAAFNCLRAFL